MNSKIGYKVFVASSALNLERLVAEWIIKTESGANDLEIVSINSESRTIRSIKSSNEVIFENEYVAYVHYRLK